MRYYLENEILKIEIDSFGAELKSVLNKNNYREYMWYGNKKFWGRTSPVLFPFVGSLKNKEYKYEGKSYPMGQHGFARDNEHELIEQTDTSIWFSFKSNSATYELYPFDFELQCGYELSGNELKVLWRVLSPEDAEKDIYFSIGAHPAFLCPVHGEEDFSNYKLFFKDVDILHHHGNVVSTGMALMEDETIPLKDNRVVITKDFFDKCTYMIEDHQTTQVGIEDPDGRRIIDVDFDSPLFAVWSPEGKKAPFICIEPWYGRCDRDDFDGELKDRDFTNILSPGERFEASYTIRYYEI